MLRKNIFYIRHKYSAVSLSGCICIADWKICDKTRVIGLLENGSTFSN